MITKTLTFEQLPSQEKVLIRSVINALNQSRSAEDIDRLALANFTLRTPEPSSLAMPWRNLGKRAATDSWSTLKNGAQAKKLWNDFIDDLGQRAIEEVREELAALVRTGRLPEHSVDSLVQSFKADVVIQPKVEVKDGRARISEQLSFRSGIGAISYAVLRLSQLNADEPALLICEECQKLKLIESTGGDKISRFCSKECRNRFSVRKWRADRRTPRKPK